METSEQFPARIEVMLTVEELIGQAIREGHVVEGINDPETLKRIEEGRTDIHAGSAQTEEEIHALIDRWAVEQMFSFRRPHDVTERVVSLMREIHVRNHHGIRTGGTHSLRRLRTYSATDEETL